MSDTLPKSDLPDPGFSQEDWDEVSDNPELTDAELAEMRPAREVPEVYSLLPKRPRGRPKLADAKVHLTLRIDPAVLDAYRASGPGWQTRMHEVLEAAITPRSRARSIAARLRPNKDAGTKKTRPPGGVGSGPSTTSPPKERPRSPVKS